MPQHILARATAGLGIITALMMMMTTATTAVGCGTFGHRPSSSSSSAPPESAPAAATTAEPGGITARSPIQPRTAEPRPMYVQFDRIRAPKRPERTPSTPANTPTEGGDDDDTQAAKSADSPAKAQAPAESAPSNSTSNANIYPPHFPFVDRVRVGNGIYRRVWHGPNSYILDPTPERTADGFQFFATSGVHMWHTRTRQGGNAAATHDPHATYAGHSYTGRPR